MPRHLVPAVDNPEATLALKELSSELWKLNPQSREALVLIGAGGFSYEEAASLCGCSVGTLKARVSRARKYLSDRAPIDPESANCMREISIDLKRFFK